MPSTTGMRRSSVDLDKRELLDGIEAQGGLQELALASADAVGANLHLLESDLALVWRLTLRYRASRRWRRANRFNGPARLIAGCRRRAFACELGSSLLAGSPCSQRGVEGAVPRLPRMLWAHPQGRAPGQCRHEGQGEQDQRLLSFVAGGRQTPITGQTTTGVVLERNGKCERRSSSSLSR